MRLFVFSLCCALAAATAAPTWPLPYAKYTSRPARDPRCRVSEQQRFCPGEVDVMRLDFNPNDVLDIYVLSGPAADFDLTPMDSFKRTKVGLALHSRMQNKNYTISYGPLSSVLDATVPLIIPKKELLWCNQAAVCVTARQDRSGWSLRQRVGMIGGDKMDALLVWLLRFNATKPFFETFTLRQSADAADGQVWMLQLDDTRFLLQSLQLLQSVGATFFKNSTLRLSALSLFCEAPQLLGPPAEVKEKDPAAFESARDFFELLQPSHNVFTRVFHRIKFYIEVDAEGRFFYLYNQLLWRLKLVAPKIKVQPMTIVV